MTAARDYGILGMYMFKLLKYLKGYRAAAVAAPLFKIIEAIIELIIPLIVAYMIDTAITEGDLPLVFGLGALMAGLSCVGLGFSLACQYLASKAAVGMGCNIRTALYAHLHKLNLGDSDRMGTGALVNRLSTDVAQAQQGFAMSLRLMLRAPVIAAGGCGLIVDAIYETPSTSGHSGRIPIWSTAASAKPQPIASKAKRSASRLVISPSTAAKNFPGVSRPSASNTTGAASACVSASARAAGKAAAQTSANAAKAARPANPNPAKKSFVIILSAYAPFAVHP